MFHHAALQLAVAVGLLLAGASAGKVDQNPYGGNDDNSRAPYSIGLWGDLPYSPLQATVGVPNLIADMNANKLAFTVFDGDLQQGSGRCEDSLYYRSLNYFSSLEAPAAVTPGDNDWVDCDRPTNGNYNSLERLDFERSVLFNTSYTLGQKKLPQEVQTEPLCLNAARQNVPCVENRRWMYNGVMYMTANVQGSCNNLCDTNPDQIEWAARNAANIAWLMETFASAKARGAVALMLVSQADPVWDVLGTDKRDKATLFLTTKPATPDGFQSWLLAVREETLAFGKPVVYVHGDTHYFVIDKPLYDNTGKRIQRFTRVQTFGDNAQTGNDDVQWVKVDVDPKSREVFSYTPMTIPANIVRRRSALEGRKLRA